jgi:hypothetical protein
MLRSSSYFLIHRLRGKIYHDQFSKTQISCHHRDLPIFRTSSKISYQDDREEYNEMLHQLQEKRKSDQKTVSHYRTLFSM